jgi:hypothetical protein
MTTAVRFGVPAALALLGSLAAPAALAAVPAAALEDRAGGSHVSLSADSLARSDRRGAMLVLGVRERWATADGPFALLRDRYVALGLSAGVNPDYLQGAAFVDWAPLSVLTLSTRYDVFDFLEDGRSGVAHRLTFAPGLRLALGRVALHNGVEVAHYRLTGAMEGQTFREWDHDLEIAGGNWVVVTRSSLLVDLWRGDGAAGLRVGPGYEVARQQAAHLTRQRALAMLQFVPSDSWRVRMQVTGGVDVAPGSLRGERFVSGGLGMDLDIP